MTLSVDNIVGGDVCRTGVGGFVGLVLSADALVVSFTLIVVLVGVVSLVVEVVRRDDAVIVVSVVGYGDVEVGVVVTVVCLGVVFNT